MPQHADVDKYAAMQDEEMCCLHAHEKMCSSIYGIRPTLSYSITNLLIRPLKY